MPKLFRSVAFWIVIALVIVLGASQLLGKGPSREKLRYDEFTSEVNAGRVAKADIKVATSKVEGELADGTKFQSTYVKESADRLTQLLDSHNVKYQVTAGGSSAWVAWLFNLLPIILLVGFFLFIMNSVQGGGSRVMQFGKAKAKQVGKDQPKVTFADVAGCDEAVEELQEIKEFLESPAKFQAIGAKIPKGVLLFGPPGTG
ncbi:MAG: cell division protease FtsH, partial [Actinomycetota bacterium]|nr:cell division protease FtsH [Actinomycetota bacterium]